MDEEHVNKNQCNCLKKREVVHKVADGLNMKFSANIKYFSLTGINHDIAIDVAFLPLFCPDNPHLFQLEDIQNDTLLSCMSCISACQQKATSSGRLRDTFCLSGETAFH